MKTFLLVAVAILATTYAGHCRRKHRSALAPTVYSTVPRIAGEMYLRDSVKASAALSFDSFYAALSKAGKVLDVCYDSSTGSLRAKSQLLFRHTPLFSRPVKLQAELRIRKDGGYYYFEGFNYVFLRGSRKWSTRATDLALLKDRRWAHTFYNMARFHAELQFSYQKDQIKALSSKP